MSLSIVGSGAASPFGLTPKEHVVFLRAHLPGPATSPFLLGDDRRLRVCHCPWLDAALPADERMAWLARAALDEALGPLRELGVAAGVLSIVLPAPRPGVDHALLDRLVAVIESVVSPQSVHRWSGAAGVFAAFAHAASAPDRGPPTVIVAVDSFIDLAWLTRLVLRPPTRWESPGPPPSEAAAALVVVPPARARQLGLSPIGTVHAAAVASGAANEENDEPVDAVAMTELLGQIAPPRIYYAFGQDTVDTLRREDWHRAVARHRDRFWDCQHLAIEDDVGTLGAASGAVSVVIGLWTLKLRAAPDGFPHTDPFLAWALSRDGTRGVASVSIEGP